MHPKLEIKLRQKYNIENNNNIERELKTLLKEYLDSPKLLGMGGEGVVFQDGNHVKKFILNWEDYIGIERIYTNLRELSKRLINPIHLYKFDVELLNKDILMISYKFESGNLLSKEYLIKNWHEDLVFQYNSLQKELLDIDYWLTNPKVKNFILVNGMLKLVDYGADCVPINDAITEVGRMYFMLLNQFYELGK